MAGRYEVEYKYALEHSDQVDCSRALDDAEEALIIAKARIEDVRRLSNSRRDWLLEPIIRYFKQRSSHNEGTA